VSIIDLTKTPAEGQGQLNKFAVKADGRDDTAFVYDLDVVFVWRTRRRPGRWAC